MDLTTWFAPYLLPDDQGLDTAALLRDHASDLLGSSMLSGLSAEELQLVDACLHAVIWGYPLEETYRLRVLNTALQAPINTLFKPSYAANWLNKSSSPAPDSSVLYVTGWLDLAEEQVLHTPGNAADHYYVWAILDSNINTVGSIGPRTQTEREQDDGAYYLLCGPSSPHYTSADWITTIKTADGETSVRIIKVDTPYAWMTARFATNTLSAAALQETRRFINGDAAQEGSGFQLGSLRDFQKSGSVDYTAPVTQSQSDQRMEDRYGSVPTLARVFFEQLGQSLLDNPIPSLRTSAVDRPIPDRAVWLGNQNKVQQAVGGTDHIPERDYQPGSALTDELLTRLNARFAPIGLDLSSGFSMPTDWSARDALVFQKAYAFSQALLSEATNAIASGDRNTNYWHISNLNIGVYPNAWENWLVRTGVAIDGGAANIPNDGVYPTSQKDHEGNTLRSTYNYTITLPPLTRVDGETVYAPANGFWSYTIYQPDPGNAYQPFLIENAISNQHFTRIDASATLRGDGWLSTRKPGNWNDGTALGTALVTGADVGTSGLSASTTYYVSDSKTGPLDDRRLLIKLSDTYTPDYNWLGRSGTAGVPVGGEGSPGTSVSLSGSRGTTVRFGWIQPVAQLGSAQLDDFETNADGEIVLQLRANQPRTALSNWLPTPNEGYVGDAYNFQVMARYYEPTWADETTVLASSGDQQYLPPAIERTSLHRIALWEDLDQAGIALLEERLGTTSVDPFAKTDRFDADAVGALLDLRWADGALEGTNWTLSYSYRRDAAYTNQLFFYVVDDVTGTVGALRPGDPGYLDAALSQRINANDPIVNAVDRSTLEGSLQLDGGRIYMPLVVTEDGRTILPNARSSFNYSHFSVEGMKAFAFEDLFQGGDHDHDDGLFSVTGLTPVG